jgi:hypothetical protein
MSPTDWEDFVLEWAHSLSAYKTVEKCAGAGDMGRDVIAYPAGAISASIWHNYQCKHYAGRLAPHNIWCEIGKLIYYTSQGHYTVPERYFFVAPCGVGTLLSGLLKKPAQLRNELFGNWDKYCRNGITKTKAIPLVGKLKTYAHAFDFGIFGHISPLALIDGHSRTRWHLARFGGSLPSVPSPPPPPQTVDPALEARYVEQLLCAYADHAGCVVGSCDDLALHPELAEHFRRSRRDFYAAEALQSFSRDSLPPGSFEDLQEDVFDAVVDTACAAHPSGYVRVTQTTEQAVNAQITAHALTTCWRPRDRKGICHQLANKDRFTWVP